MPKLATCAEILIMAQKQKWEKRRSHDAQPETTEDDDLRMYMMFAKDYYEVTNAKSNENHQVNRASQYPWFVIVLL
jgi:hypothetical protein